MNQIMGRVSITALTAIYIAFALACKSTQPSVANMEECLARTDFAGMHIEQRNRIAWLVDYDHKVRQTKCCAIEPRSSLLTKQSNISPLKAEVLRRIDILEADGDSEARANLRHHDACYAALMDLYHDVKASQRQR